jgi:tRNA pseudouridine13 synthase
MALREVTKIDTSSHVQTSLTMASEDQYFKGTGRVDSEPPVDAEIVDDGAESEIGILDDTTG